MIHKKNKTWKEYGGHKPFSRRRPPHLDITIARGLVKLNDDLISHIEKKAVLSVLEISKLIIVIKSLIELQKIVKTRPTKTKQKQPIEQSGDILG